MICPIVRCCETHKEQLDALESGDDYTQRQLSLKGAWRSVARESPCVRLFQRAELLLTLASDSIAAREQCNHWTTSATWTQQHCAAEQPPLVKTQISGVYYFTLFTHRLLSARCSTGLRAKYLHKNRESFFGSADPVVEQ